MSKKKSSTSAPTPAAPSPQNEYFYDDNFLRSQRVYDKGQKGYVTKTFSSPDEQAIDSSATGFIRKLVDTVPQKFDMSPDQISAYREAYAAPQRQALTDSYNQAKGAAEAAAASRGMRNSVGFADYMVNQIEKQKAQGLADIEANAKLQEYDLPRKVLAPYGDAFNIVNAALAGEQSRAMNQLEPAFQGSQAASNFALSNYANQLNAWNAQNANQANNRGFFSKLFGGF